MSNAVQTGHLFLILFHYDLKIHTQQRATSWFWNTRSPLSHTLKVTQTATNGPQVWEVQIWRKNLEDVKTELLYAGLPSS